MTHLHIVCIHILVGLFKSFASVLVQLISIFLNLSASISHKNVSIAITLLENLSAVKSLHFHLSSSRTHKCGCTMCVCVCVSQLIYLLQSPPSLVQQGLIYALAVAHAEMASFLSANPCVLPHTSFPC